MSDPFFQKKRKRTTSQSGGSGPGGRGSRRDGAKGGPSKAGPSGLRMRDKSLRGRGGDEGDEKDDASRPDVDEDDDEEDGGIEGMDLAHRFEQDVRESDEDEQETPAEARVRLAKLYLDSLKDDDVDPDDIDAAAVDRQNISSRLQADAATHSTHLHNFVADKMVDVRGVGEGARTIATTNILACRGHRLSVTTAIIAPDCTSIWTAGKDGRIVRWRLRDGKMLEVISKAALAEEGAGKQQHNRPRSGSSGAARRRARSRSAMTAQTKTNGATGGIDGHATNGEKAVSRLDEESNVHCQLSIPKAGQGHSDEVWALAASQDGKYLVSGGKDRRICVWQLGSGGKGAGNARSDFIKHLGGHKDSITGLRFRQGTHDLFSASLDRTLKLYDVSQLSYVETFFGHQEDVAGLDVLRGEVAVSAGSRDRTVRWWKVREESQLVFRGGARSRVRDVLEGGDIMDAEEEGEEGNRSAHVNGQQKVEQLVEGSIEAVAMVDEHSFLSGGDTGTLCLWSLAKKKPVFSVAAAHGFEDAPQLSNEGGKTARWITSLACLPYGDVFASGSWDGSIRLWKLSSSLKSFAPLCVVPALGFVNALQLVQPTRSIVKRRGGRVVEPESWRRHGGLKGGAKKIFTDDGMNEANQGVSKLNGTSATTTPPPPLLLVAAVGQEPMRGRWHRIMEAHNGTLLIPFTLD